MSSFDHTAFSSLSGLVLGHLQFLETSVLGPFRKRMEPFMQVVKSEVRELTASFLGCPPVAPSEVASQQQFYSESHKRDVGASLRRLALGVQSRGLHLCMRQAVTKQEHLWIAEISSRSKTAAQGFRG